MTRSQTRKLVLTAVVTALAVGVSYALTMLPLPPDAGSTCATSLTAPEFNTWFASGAVTLNGLVKPANSVLFPNVPNCSFYKWSEQMFLWLTSPAPPSYGGGGLVMNTPVFYDVSLPDASGHRHFQKHSAGLIKTFNLRTAQKGALDLPIILEKGTLRVLEIVPPVLSRSGRQMVADKDGNEVEIGTARFMGEGKPPLLLDVRGQVIQSPRALLPRDLAGKLSRLDHFDQSELVQKIVLDNKSTVVITPVGTFPPTEQGQADGGVLMAQNGSLVYYSLMANNVFALYRTMQGATVPAGTKLPITQPELDAITTFAASNGMAPVIDSEALAIEIKSSWVEAAGLGPDASTFIQMRAIVPTYDKTNPNDWVPNGTKIVTLAMVGLHVVGSTKGHPEMLWGTFEHLSNGPSAQYSYTKAPIGTGTIPQNTVGSWVFTANGAVAPFNEMHMQMGGAGGTHILPLPSFTISPSNVLRVMPWGLPGTSAVGNAEVISINNTVRALLNPADIRRNYFHGGTTWTIGGASPTAFNQVGTNKLANTTMETFFQGNNCFSCHVTNTTAVSHIFDDTDPLF